MTDIKDPKELLASTTPQVRKLIDEILKVEREYQNYQNLSQLKDKESELCERIIKLIEQEVKE